MFASLLSDFRFAVRQLRHSPGFACTAVLTLALGIGTTTAIYSLIHGVLLKPLPLPHPEQLVTAYTLENQPGHPPDWQETSYPNYLDWRSRTHDVFSELAAINTGPRLVSRTNGSHGQIRYVARVSANYFDTLGILPVFGRNFAFDEDQPGRHVAIISYGYWQQVFGGDPHALGATILISDEAYTIIGVMPKGFIPPAQNETNIWTSFALYLEGSAPRAKDRGMGVAEVLGRLRPGVTIKQANASLNATQAVLAKTYPENRFRTSVSVQSKLSDLTGDMRPALLMLMAAVLSVLLIVCINVSGLMLTRTLKRRGEITVRAALGASSQRIWRQLLIESLLLGIIGGALGIGLAYLLLHAALPLIPEDIPRLGEVVIDGRVLAFTVALSLACACFSNLVPAWKLSRVSPINALREQAQNTTTGRHTHRFQNSLVIAQTALGFALLLASGLLIRGFVNVRHAKTGFRPDHLLTFYLPLTPTHYPNAKKAIFMANLMPKLAAIPGVLSASGGDPFPLEGTYASANVEIDGRPNPPDRPLSTLVGDAEPGMFETLGIPLIRGRGFTVADNDPRSPLVAIVNQTFVKTYYPNEDPIGRHIRPDLNYARVESNNLDPTVDGEREIIGVVADTQQGSVTEPPQPMATFPFSQASILMRPNILLRVAGDPMQYGKPAQAIISNLDPFLFVANPHSMEMQLADNASTQRFETLLVSAFASIALFLTGLGLYATLAAMVASRTREIGLRIAVGAKRNDIARLVFARALVLVAMGLLIGSVMVLFTARGLSASDWWKPLLFGVSWLDLRTYFTVFLVLGTVSTVACLLPVLRAVRIDPIRVLRDE